MAPANETRGEISLQLDGVDFVLRPSFEALVAIEQDSGKGLIDLAREAEGGTLSLQTVAIIAMRCIQAWGAATKNEMAQGVNADKIARLIMSSDGGLMAAMLRIRILLTLAVTGGYTPSGERKAAGSPGTIPAAS